MSKKYRVWDAAGKSADIEGDSFSITQKAKSKEKVLRIVTGKKVTVIQSSDWTCFTEVAPEIVFPA